METLLPDAIRALRGELSRADFAARLGVTAVTVYRWELPRGAPEARSPRGKVLERVLRFRAQTESSRRLEAVQTSKPAPQPLSLNDDERNLVTIASNAIDQCDLVRAEGEIVALLTSGRLSTEAGRAFATILLAKLHLLARYDAKSAFSALVSVGSSVEALPADVQLEFHLTSAFLHAHPDTQLFNPGKTNHHIELAENSSHAANGDQRFFLWYTGLVAAAALYEHALIARAMERFASIKVLATTPLNHCLVDEAEAVASLGLNNLGQAIERVERLDLSANERGLPLQQVRAKIWRAELAIEEAAAPTRVLQLIEPAALLHHRARLADGMHTMLMRRNWGDTLVRMGRREEGIHLLVDAASVARAISYTPIRIHTSLARLYIQSGQLADVLALAEACEHADDAQRDLTRVFGRTVKLLCTMLQGDAAADWCPRIIDEFRELSRLGIWPVAYRQLVLLAVAAAIAKAGPSAAAALVVVAERAVELSPSPTASAALRRYQGMMRIRANELLEGRQLLESSLATFDASGDRVEVALVRRSLANIDWLEDKPGAEERLRESERELRQLSIVVPPLIEPEADSSVVAVEGTSEVTALELRIEALVVPIQRLTARGLSTHALHQELTQVTAGLFPARRVRLEEIAPDGGSTLLDERGNAEGPFTWHEFGDGVGGRFRLGVSGSLPTAAKAALVVIVGVASHALELASLRGFGTPRKPSVEAPAQDEILPNFIAVSPSLRRLKDELLRLSGSRATIIVRGESGTGKEVVARAIHDLSRRASGPYVTFNSATVPRELFEGQLFGYRKGAFTGATSDYPGVIRSAHGGTLFLDEIGELPMDIQPKLLRFLENGEVLPLGERKPVDVDVRVIAATHRDLHRLVNEGKFREDLYYRLEVIPVVIPPLRERKEDVVALAKAFLRRLTPSEQPVPILTAEAEQKLLAHAWPGNVRQLRNVIERCLAFDPVPRLISPELLRM